MLEPKDICGAIVHFWRAKGSCQYDAVAKTQAVKSIKSPEILSKKKGALKPLFNLLKHYLMLNLVDLNSVENQLLEDGKDVTGNPVKHQSHGHIQEEEN